MHQPWHFIVRGAREVLGVAPENGNWRPPPLNDLPDWPGAEHYLGRLRGADCLLRSVAENVEAPAGMCFLNLYQLLARCDDAVLAMAGSAVQIARWDRDHRYCGRCAQPTRLVDNERRRRCEDCELDFYPRLSPCAIIIVRRGEEMLLANGVRHPQGMYSALAGFMEPGESVEACARREVAEEVALQIKEPEYFGSQAWPFPHQLMIGLVADYHSGEIKADREEIRHARWWHYQDLPEVPGEYSIAGRMIQALRRRIAGQHT